MPTVVRTKLILAGDPAVGKTALVQMFSSSGQRFPKTYQLTSGVEYAMKAVPIPDTDISVELHIFDTGGQDLFSEMLPAFWQGGEAIMLVYDVARPYTFEACRNWYHQIREVLSPSGPVPGVLVANKMDLHERVAVMRQDGMQMAQELGLQYSEVSAKDGDNVLRMGKRAIHEVNHASAPTPRSHVSTVPSPASHALQYVRSRARWTSRLS